MAFFMNGGFPFGFGGGDDDDFGGFGGHSHGEKKEVDTNKLYEVMGIEKTATQDEVRKAYKKLAVKHHPDRGGEQEKFQELQHAYEILSDESKRKVYDQYGEEGVKEGRDEYGGGDIFDLLNGRATRPQKRKTKSVLHTLNVTLEDIYAGKRKQVTFQRYKNCAKCKGVGAKDPKANIKCQSCKGQGIKVVVRSMGNAYIQQQVTCPDCKGEGKILSEKDKCVDCKGERVKRENKTLDVDVDKGAPDGKRYIFAGESDEVPEAEPGDVVVEILIEKHKKFSRKGADLVFTADITLLEALTGFSIVVEHLDGRKICIKTRPGEIIKPGVLKTVKECGMPFLDAPYKYGNLYVNFNIVFPEKIDNTQTEMLNKLFPHAIQQEIKESVDETYEMTDYKAEDENTHYSGGKKEHKRSEDEDDEESQGGAKQMRCGHQ